MYPNKRMAEEDSSAEYFCTHIEEWDKAVAMSEQRKQAIADWETEKNNELRGVAELNCMGAIMQKYDNLFAAILKKFPVKTIHDHMALDRGAGIKGYLNGKHIDAYLAGKCAKSNALSRLILRIVGENPKLTAPELIAALERETGQGIIVDFDDEFFYFVKEELDPNDNEDDGKALDKASKTGMKDRLSRAKNPKKKRKKSR